MKYKSLPFFYFKLLIIPQKIIKQANWDGNMPQQGLGDLVPEDFPNGKLNTIGYRIGATLEVKSRRPFHDLFFDLWIAVAYRFITCTEHDTGFRRYMQDPDHNRPQVNHYMQERELFGFFVSGLASLECLSFSCYVLAAILDEKKFPIRDQREITVGNTVQKYNKLYPSENLSWVLTRFQVKWIIKIGKISEIYKLIG